MLDIWNGKSEIADKIYHGKNYRIEYCENQGGYCYIFCSSNNIWYPNEISAFERAFIENDHYEWSNYRPVNAEKIIWIRDIYKSWYVTGINNEIDSIDKLIIFLKKETEGYKVITVGSSAGGYIAVLIGCELKAERVLAFSPQFELHNKWAEMHNIFLKRYSEERNKYYDLLPLMNDAGTPIYYFSPAYSDTDIYQYEHVKECKNVNVLRLKSRRHGVVLPKCCLSILVDMDMSDIDALFKRYSHTVNPIIVSAKLVGWIKTIRGIVKEIYQKYMAK